MSRWLQWCENILWHMVDLKTGLFSYSTRIENGHYRNDFTHPLRIRYTVNTYAGLLRARSFLQKDWDVPGLFEKFLQTYPVENPGDQGLLLLVLTDYDPDRALEWFHTIQSTVTNPVVLAQRPVQELCWLLWGITALAHRTQYELATEQAHALWKLIHKDFFCRDSLFPYHQHQWYRKRFVSFGALTYFLRASFSYAKVFQDRYVQVIAEELTKRLIQQQGHRGEWGWFYDVYRGCLVEWYPVYSVHQDSMAMLFLFPALDAGIAEAELAIERSFHWLLGENDLNTPMLRSNPPLIYRSIHRAEPMEAGLRLLRAWKNALLDRSPQFASAQQLQINTECRSYHIGWILYVWSNRLRQLPSSVEKFLSNEVQVQEKNL